jgi:predicted Rossmann fold flavoprotein
MSKIISEQFDVAVIGAGPAGMMAAIRAAQKGARVVLIEKKEQSGTKLLMTGNGRCNLTQDENDIIKLSQKYGRNGKFILASLKSFRPKAVREFFAGSGVPTKVEKDGRVFPESDQSKSVLEALVKVLKENGITFLYKSDIVDFEFNSSEIPQGGSAKGAIPRGKITKLNLKKREIIAKNYIIATGGKSYPNTGSTGNGYEWAEKMGHTIITPTPILVPIKVKEDWISELQGVSANSVSMSVYQNGKNKFSEFGDLMFAHFGLSGPLALNISRELAHVISNGEIKLIIDFKPYLSFEKLDEIVRKDFEKNGKIKLANCLQDLFSPKLLDFLLKHSGLDLEKHAAKISRKERQKLVALFKGLEMHFESLFGFEKAMATSGGVSTKEIDSKTMKSKIIANLFFAGEIIDVDGPTGGYNLQICWSTGYVAGENAA